MNTVHALVISAMILLVGLFLYQIAIYVAVLLTKKHFTASTIFKDFKQKIWMTAFLGSVFFGFYLLLIYGGSFLKDPDWRLHLFFTMYKHPTAFIYLGLLTFVMISISIYLARMAIKFLYNRKKRN